MARIKAPLAEKLSAKLAKQPGMHAVGGVPGLYLRVNGTARSWVFRYMIAGRRRDMGLGSYLDLTLAEAREKAAEQRKLLKDKNNPIDPIDAWRDKRATLMVQSMRRMSFQQCVDGYLKAHGDTWKNPKHRQQWKNTLETYACTHFGTVSVALIDTPMVLSALEPIWKEKTETASRVRGRIEAVLDWATARKLRVGDNPARWKGNLDHLLAAPNKIAKVEHHAALPYAEAGEFMLQLRLQEGFAARALEFAILTATRSGEVRGATWDEINLEDGVWIIPADRMKAKREHRIPLSTDALSVIKAMNKIKFGKLVFPGAKEGRPLSDMALTAVLRRMKRGDLTAHGFRSTFRDWAAECTSYPREVCEMALAHAIENQVEAAYRRGDLFEKRAKLMAEWAAYCAIPVKIEGTVTPINKKSVG